MHMQHTSSTGKQDVRRQIVTLASLQACISCERIITLERYYVSSRSRQNKEVTKRDIGHMGDVAR